MGKYCEFAVIGSGKGPGQDPAFPCGDPIRPDFDGNFSGIGEPVKGGVYRAAVSEKADISKASKVFTIEEAAVAWNLKIADEK